MNFGDFYYPMPANEPVLNYAPGSKEAEDQQKKHEKQQDQQLKKENQAKKECDGAGSKCDLQSGKDEKVIRAAAFVVVADFVGQSLASSQCQRLD